MISPVRAIGLLFIFASVFNVAQAQLSPACWTEARMLSMGEAPDEWAQRVQLFTDHSTHPEPLYVTHSVTPGSNLNHASVIASSTRGGTLRVQLDHIASPVTAKRIGDALLYLRIPWSRVSFSDVLIDIESATVLAHKQILDGRIAMDQAKASCALPEMAELPQCQCPESKPVENLFPNNATASNSIIGLVTIPQLFGVAETGAVVEAAAIAPIALRSKPDALIEPEFQIDSIDQLEWREFSYESAAAVVLSTLDGWYQLRMYNGQTGWFMSGDDNQFISLTTLFEKRLSYLTPEWSGQLWELNQNVWISSAFEAAAQQDIEVIIYASRNDQRGLWFDVGILENSPCDGSKLRIMDRGWVPAWNPDGQLNLWFYSRGC